MAVDRLGELEAAALRAQQEGVGEPPPDAAERDLEAPPEADPSQEAPIVDSSSEEKASDEDRLMDMPRFFAQAQEVQDATAAIKTLRKELERAHKAALAAATPDESEAASRVLAVATARLNERIGSARATLRDMETRTREISTNPEVPRGSGHLRMRQTKHRQLAGKFVRASRKVQDLQTQYCQKYRRQLERQYLIVHPEATEEQAREVSQGSADPARTQMFALAVREDARNTLAQMQSRLGDVQQIEQSIADLARMFLELQDMIVAQGDKLDSIESSIGDVADYVEAAAQELSKASTLQRSIQRKKWMIAACIVVAVIILVLIAVFMLKLLMMPFMLMGMAGRR